MADVTDADVSDHPVDDSCDAGPDVFLLDRLFGDSGTPNWVIGPDGGVEWIWIVTCCGGRTCEGYCDADGGCSCGDVPSSCAPLRCCLVPFHPPAPACESCIADKPN